jgi:hypothetical protein
MTMAVLYNAKFDTNILLNPNPCSFYDKYTIILLSTYSNTRCLLMKKSEECTAIVKESSFIEFIEIRLLKNDSHNCD